MAARLVVLVGKPAAGKLTVARELAAQTGFRLFHNHLVCDALLAVFDFGSPGFTRLREPIWLDVLREAAMAGVDVIFTICPERTLQTNFLTTLQRTFEAAGGSVRFVDVVCAAEAMQARVDSADRGTMRKLVDRDLLVRLDASGEFDLAVLPFPTDSQHELGEEKKQKTKTKTKNKNSK